MGKLPAWGLSIYPNLVTRRFIRGEVRSNVLTNGRLSDMLYLRPGGLEVIWNKSED